MANKLADEAKAAALKASAEAVSEGRQAWDQAGVQSFMVGYLSSRATMIAENLEAAREVIKRQEAAMEAAADRHAAEMEDLRRICAQ
jgi:ribosomal protein L1